MRITARSDDGEVALATTVVEVPHDAAGVPIHGASDDGDITIRSQAVPGPLGP